jgi:glycosyltransferase involved in cell wall biosynthesis
LASRKPQHLNGIKGTIGVGGAHYNYVKNILLPVQHFRHRRVYNYDHLARWAHLPGRSRKPAFFRTPCLPSVDMLHLWQQIPDTSLPWVVTTSSGLPFPWNWPSRDASRALELLASEQCHAILVSNNEAHEKQIRKASIDTRLSQTIIDKMIFQPPAQPSYFNTLDEKQRDSKAIRIAFVGHGFFRKGGVELLLAFERARKKFSQFQLTVVSRGVMAANDIFDVDYERSARARAILESVGVRWVPQMPHHEVIALLKSSDIVMLPSFAETYGYSVLEAQACGCATVTTDIGSFQETNLDDCGWRCLLGLDRDFRSYTKDEKTAVSRSLENQLLAILEMIAQSPDIIDCRGRHALNQIRRKHDPEMLARRLHDLYSSALGTEICADRLI